ncbi:MAG: cryptochrome/photolyase family protein [Sphingobacteriaceae bacterium]
MEKILPINIFWFRRDLRLQDNAGLYHALKSGLPVLPVFIFDSKILDQLEDRNDARVTFIHQTMSEINEQLLQYNSSVLIRFGDPITIWREIIGKYPVHTVFTNHDYEPYAAKRDQVVTQLLKNKQILFKTFKDQVIFEKEEISKDDGTTYNVFTPYKRKWLEKLKPFYFRPFPVEKYFSRFLSSGKFSVPSLAELDFTASKLTFPKKEHKEVIGSYSRTRDFPAIKGTSHIGLHLRFGTVSIRALVQDAVAAESTTWLSELIWRDFYAMLLWRHPQTATHAFQPAYDRIQWQNDENEFQAWCDGQTGYPLVDAGMRELNTTGFMHNRVRMVVASFLSKHLLIDWRWGERYFARKLLDYDLASNVGGWQWAAGCGADAAPYFRIFSPELQMKKFDQQLKYVKKWVPEYADFSQYPNPIVNHVFARERCLAIFKAALIG